MHEHVPRNFHPLIYLDSACCQLDLQLAKEILHHSAARPQDKPHQAQQLTSHLDGLQHLSPTFVSYTCRLRLIRPLRVPVHFPSCMAKCLRLEVFVSAAQYSRTLLME